MRTPEARVTTALLAGLVSAALIVGCAEDPTNGTPQPAEAQPPQTTQQPDSALPHSGAPNVTDPIETAAFEADPCNAITEAQLKSIELNLYEVQPDPEFPAGPSCDYLLDPVGSGSVGFTFLTANTQGLSNVYAKDEAGGWGLFEPIDPIEGYPAVIADIQDSRGDGYCSIEVGVRDDLTFSIGVAASRDESPNHDDPCGAAREAAALAIQTMKGGA